MNFNFKTLLFILIAIMICSYNVMAAEESVDQQLKRKTSKAIVLCINKPNALVGGVKETIDSNNCDVVPFIQDDRTLMPIRFLAESIGAIVNWDSQIQKVSIKFNDKTLEFGMDSNLIYVNGEQKEIDTYPKIINNRIFIPLKPFADSFGLNTFWDECGIVGISFSEILLTNEDKDILNRLKQLLEFNNVNLITLSRMGSSLNGFNTYNALVNANVVLEEDLIWNVFVKEQGSYELIISYSTNDYNPFKITMQTGFDSWEITLKGSGGENTFVRYPIGQALFYKGANQLKLKCQKDTLDTKVIMKDVNIRVLHNSFQQKNIIKPPVIGSVQVGEIIELDALSASIIGTNIVHTESSIENWTNDGIATWTVEAKSAGDYNVEIELSVRYDTPDVGLINVGNESYEMAMNSTGAWANYERQIVGSVHLEEGANTLSIQNATKLNTYFMNLKSITLIPKN